MGLLYIRNNEILDKGMGYICDALLDNVGLISLVVWNNGITHESSPALAKVLVHFKLRHYNTFTIIKQLYYF